MRITEAGAHFSLSRERDLKQVAVRLYLSLPLEAQNCSIAVECVLIFVGIPHDLLSIPL